MKFETEFTREFIRRSLPQRARRLLEIGCGGGELAASLLQDGFSLVAIDSDADSIADAQKLRVDARLAAWPEFEDGQFDAVLFTRSLHHIHPLGKAVHRAADSLVLGGRLIVEDFAHEAADEKALQWFGRLIERLDSAGVLIRGDDFVDAVRAKTATLRAWREIHEPDLHTAAAILTEIRKIFGKTRCEEVPYYFRYLSRAIAPPVDRDRILRDLVEEETELIGSGTIRALGRRFVAERRNKS